MAQVEGANMNMMQIAIMQMKVGEVLAVAGLDRTWFLKLEKIEPTKINGEKLPDIVIIDEIVESK